MLEYLSYLPRLPVHFIQFSNVVVNCEIPNTFKMRHFTVTTFTVSCIMPCSNLVPINESMNYILIIYCKSIDRVQVKLGLAYERKR